MNDFYVFVSDTDLSGKSFNEILSDDSISKTRVSDPACAIMDIDNVGTGRFVRIQLAGTNYLHMAEVQVFANV